MPEPLPSWTLLPEEDVPCPPGCRWSSPCFWCAYPGRGLVYIGPMDIEERDEHEALVAGRMTQNRALRTARSWEDFGEEVIHQHEQMEILER